MRTLRTLIATPLALFMALSTPAAAQDRHAVTPEMVAQAAAQHAATQDAQRATVREALARPEVQQIATAAGLDLAKANAAIDSLSGDTLTQAASQAQQLNDSLVGGASTITISTTTIIIVLLLVILILVID